MEDPTRDSYALKMYSQKKASIEITPTEPQFLAKYVGKTQVFVASGKGCTQKAVQKIWDDCYDEKGMRRVSLLVNSSGITMKDTESSKGRECLFDIKEIAYCCAEQGIHERIFSWICKDPKTKKLECHSVLFSVKERAQLMSLTLHQAFHIAYKDWKRAKEKRAMRARKSDSEQNGHQRKRNSQNSLSQDSGSISDDSEGGSSDGVSSLLETIVAQMNIVEEEEMCMMDNAIVIKAN